MSDDPSPTPPRSIGPSRRALLGWGVGGLGALALGRVASAQDAPPDEDVLEAICARIVPTDDLPGAREAGAAGYVRAALATPYFAGRRRLVEEGLRRVEAVAQEAWEEAFVRLSAFDQDQLLLWVQGGGADGGGWRGEVFFEVLVMLTLEGFLGDPGQGGNVGEAGWRCLGVGPEDPKPGACLGSELGRRGGV